jgi:arabinofuranan 3-O-arabinosyltransferase
VGCGALLGLAIFTDPSVSDRLALTALIALTCAALVGWIELLVEARLAPSSAGLGQPWRFPHLAWPFVFVVAGLLPAVSAQTWFRGSTVVAAGDVTLPIGTAWTNHLFDAWVWSGSNLGGPGALQLQLPWALLLKIVSVLGGSEALAQRLWLTTLFIGVGLSGAILARAIGLHPIGGLVAGVLYAFNPYTLSMGLGTVYAVFLATQIAIALLASIVFLVARQKIGIWQGAMLLGISGPLLSVLFQTPPQFGIGIAALPFAVVLAWWFWGTRAAKRCLRAVLIGIPLIVILSAYWIVPAAIQVGTAARGHLEGVDTWLFAEGRATLANAFWLNPHWTWAIPEYVPYASEYSRFPLSALIYLYPAVLASLLVLTQWTLGIGSRHRNEGLALTVPMFSMVVVLVFFSTGTRFPAGPVFSRLYALPYGWLLREPVRFLVFNCLIYSLLAAVLVTRVAGLRVGVSNRFAPVAQIWARLRRWLPGPTPSTLAAALLCALGLGLAYPMLTGAVIPDRRMPTPGEGGGPGQLPAAHVNVPSYWTDMAFYLNSSTRRNGAVLILPLDDFYQVSYTFGFHGADTFIPNLIDRHVILPLPQGYFQVTPGLQAAVTLTAEYLRNQDWTSAGKMLSTLGVSYILVRGDIAPSLVIPNSDLPENYELVSGDPLVALDHVSGPLKLLATTQIPQSGTRTTSNFWTVDTPAIDPHLLASVPVGVHLVSHHPIPGVPSLPVGGGNPVIDSSSATAASLTISDTGYSQDWVGPAGAEHVMADGMFNGWITMSDPGKSVDVHYRYAVLISTGYIVSVLGLLVLVLVSLVRGGWLRRN